MTSPQDLQAIVDGWNSQKNAIQLSGEGHNLLGIIYKDCQRQGIAQGLSIADLIAESGMPAVQVDSLMRYLHNVGLAVMNRNMAFLHPNGYEVFEPEQQIMSRIVCELYKLHTVQKYSYVVLPRIASESLLRDYVTTSHYLKKLEAQRLVALEQTENSGKKKTRMWLTGLGAELAKYLNSKS